MKNSFKKAVSILVAVAVTIGLGTLISSKSKSASVNKNLTSGKEYYINQNYEQAIECFNKVLQKDSTSVEAYYFKTNSLVALDELDTAIAVVEFGCKKTQASVLENLRDNLLKDISVDSSVASTEQSLITNVSETTLAVIESANTSIPEIEISEVKSTTIDFNPTVDIPEITTTETEETTTAEETTSLEETSAESESGEESKEDEKSEGDSKEDSNGKDDSANKDDDSNSGGGDDSNGDGSSDGEQVTEVPSDGDGSPNGEQVTEVPSDGDDSPDGEQVTEVPSDGDGSSNGEQVTEVSSTTTNTTNKSSIVTSTDENGNIKVTVYDDELYSVIEELIQKILSILNIT